MPSMDTLRPYESRISTRSRRFLASCAWAVGGAMRPSRIGMRWTFRDRMRVVPASQQAEPKLPSKPCGSIGLGVAGKDFSAFLAPLEKSTRGKSVKPMCCLLPEGYHEWDQGPIPERLRTGCKYARRLVGEHRQGCFDPPDLYTGDVLGLRIARAFRSRLSTGPVTPKGASHARECRGNMD
jgi:hypothetical protein